ncbi:hypothetical protein SAMN05216218_10341 [Halorientalis regularis]|uniref:Uncharacterized protein n=2 Tax=Halorientalis regularis TaxID=660518 RepID=A0A1G7HIZ3_9EURY|nr:hypothetical protein SAMN05216218_10341 [Halorientalis regularis]
MSNMLKNLTVVLMLSVMLITAGCSGIIPGKKENTNNTTQYINETTISSPVDYTDDNNTETEKPVEKPENEHRFRDLLRSGLNKTNIKGLDYKKNNTTLDISYYGDFSNESRTTRELSFIAASFAEVVNKSYNSKSGWGISRLHITGKSANDSVVWDSIIEDWWAMKYINDDWSFNNYLDAIVASGELWNISTAQPPHDGDVYIDNLGSALQNRTDIRVLSLDKHGGEAFLTYETDDELNSSQYFDEVANVVDVYKNLTLPRSLNRTDGWYAGVLNTEIRNGNDTLEWYRYRIRWAEERVRGDMTREEEAGRLRLSRFLEKDRLRDEPHE